MEKYSFCPSCSDREKHRVGCMGLEFLHAWVGLLVFYLSYF